MKEDLPDFCRDCAFNWDSRFPCVRCGGEFPLILGVWVVEQMAPDTELVRCLDFKPKEVIYCR